MSEKDKLPLSFVFAQKLLSAIPKGVWIVVSKYLAKLAYIIDKEHSKTAKVNLDIAFGDSMDNEQKKEIIIRSYQNLFMTGLDTILNQGRSKEEILSKVEFKNEDFLQDALESGKPVIFITAHYGNWELGTLAIAAKFTPISVVGRRLDSRYADRILRATREQFGIEMIDKSNAMRKMVQSLRAKKPLGVVVDQNTSTKEGILVNFFGKEARHTPSVSILARKFDAIVIPVYDYTDDFKKWTVEFYEPLIIQKSDDVNADIEHFTQKQADITEEVIRKRPKEWLWLHKRWKNRYEELYR